MEFGKVFIILGVFFLVVGLLFTFSSKIPLGNLPGDIVIKKENYQIHFPIVTSILLSILLSFILWLFNR